MVCVDFITNLLPHVKKVTCPVLLLPLRRLFTDVFVVTSKWIISVPPSKHRCEETLAFELSPNCWSRAQSLRLTDGQSPDAIKETPPVLHCIPLLLALPKDWRWTPLLFWKNLGQTELYSRMQWYCRIEPIWKSIIVDCRAWVTSICHPGSFHTHLIWTPSQCNSLRVLPISIPRYRLDCSSLATW